MLQFLHDNNDAKAIAIPQVFSKNSQVENAAFMENVDSDQPGKRRCSNLERTIANYFSILDPKDGAEIIS